MFTRSFVAFALLLAACSHGRAVDQARVVPTPQMLADHCRDAIGERRIERLAIGYDLANTIMIHVSAGAPQTSARLTPVDVV